MQERSMDLGVRGAEAQVGFSMPSSALASIHKVLLSLKEDSRCKTKSLRIINRRIADCLHI